jgi:hypothetical protein
VIFSIRWWQLLTVCGQSDKNHRASVRSQLKKQSCQRFGEPIVVLAQGVWDKAVTLWVNAGIDIGYHQGPGDDGFLDANPSTSAEKD